VKNPSVRHGVGNLRRHGRGNAVQMASLALGLTAMLLLTFTRNDLVDAWRRSAPADAPNRFLFGVQPDELPAVKELPRPRAASRRQISIHGARARRCAQRQPVSEADYGEERHGA